jgi:hypothetical protein
VHLPQGTTKAAGTLCGKHGIDCRWLAVHGQVSGFTVKDPSLQSIFSEFVTEVNFRLNFLIPLGWAFFLVPHLFADQPVKPTLAYEGRAKVAVGSKAQVLLQAVPCFGNTITFEIQDPPLHGTLSNLKNISDHSAVVTYCHDGSQAVDSDQFSFRAKAPGRAKSSIFRMYLEIVSSLPHLVVEPSTIDFGRVMISGRSRAKVTITNTGGRLATGRIILPKGFMAPDGDGFSLQESEGTTLNLEFHPMEEGDILAKAVCSPSYESEPLTLNGVGLPRIDVIKQNETSWLVKNSSEEPCRVSFTGGNGWEMPPEIQIPAHGEKNVLFQPSSPDAGQFAGRGDSIVRVSDGLSTKEIRLPVPPRFVPIVAEPLSPANLGTMITGTPSTVCFRIRNDSEGPKQVQWSASSTSGGGMTPSTMDLKCGEFRDVRFDWSPSLPGNALLKVLIQDAGERREILWTALITEPPVEPRTGPLPIPMAAVKNVQEQVDPVKQAALIVVQGAPPQTDAGSNLKPLPPVEAGESGIRTNFFGGTTPYIKWDLQDDRLSKVLLERKTILLPSIEEVKKAIHDTQQFPEIRYRYDPLVGFHHKKDGDNEEILLLPKLPPGSHMLALTLLDGDGQSRARSEFEIVVPCKPSFWNTWRIPMGVLGIIFLLSLLRFR